MNRQRPPEQTWFCSPEMYRKMQALCGIDPDPWPTPDPELARRLEGSGVFMGIDRAPSVRFKGHSMNDDELGLEAWLPKPGDDPRDAVLFGLDRSRTVVIREASKPSLSTRLYRVWRALLGDFG